MSTCRPRPGLHRFTLPNGLRVVLDSSFPQPRVAVAVHYGTGFRSEPPGREGFAHLFEHLMFRGSASLPDGRFYDHVHRFGAQANGTTHQDYTDYYQVVPAQALERALFAEADRMRAPLFTETALAEQLRGVELEILQAVHGRPYGGFPWPLLPAVLFGTFANAHDGYGDAERLRTVTVADCEEFFDAHYAPGNAVLTVVGAADPEGIRNLVERHFAGIPARSTAPAPVLAEPRPSGERWLECTEPGVTATALTMGHRLPDPGRDLPGYLAHAVLARLTADHGPVAPGLPAVGTSCGFFGPLDARDPDALVVTALLPPDAGPREAAAAIARRWAGWAELPPAEAVRRTVRLMTGEHHRRHGDLQTRCRALGRLEILFGRADLLDRIPDHLAAIGPAEVATAARELAAAPATVLVMRPGSTRTRPKPPSGPAGTSAAGTGGADAGGAGRVPRVGAEARAIPPYGLPAGPLRWHLDDLVLDNGLHVVAVADRRAPAVEVRLRLPLGVLGGWDAPAAESLLRRGLARTRAGGRAADLGGVMEGSVDGQWMDVTGCAPPEELSSWLTVLAELLESQGEFLRNAASEPSLPGAGRTVRPTAERLMDDAVLRHWLADGRPGNASSRAALEGCVLVLNGDIAPDRALAEAREALARPDLTGFTPLPRTGGVPRRAAGGRLLVLRSPDEPEVHLTFCAPEPTAPADDAEATEAARYLATAVFGGYFGSRLAARMHGVMAASFEVYAGRDVLLDTARVFVRARVAPHLAGETLAGVRAELRRAGEEPFTDTEVADAREFCAAQALGAFDSPATQADLLRRPTAAGRAPLWLPRLPRLLHEVPGEAVARAGRELFATAAMDTVLLGADAPDEFTEPGVLPGARAEAFARR
ncbi:insulinase family protein [Streptomyces sp. NPDC019990]|uniref:M16 family metallopeptidase n=1 Tax=Streptomyces sp. NPDC019990 TaxID=3154693 RepID=UPI0033C3D1BC